MAQDSGGFRCRVCGAPSGAADTCDRCAEQLPGKGAAGPGRPQKDRSSGILLEGKYRLLDEIGRGGMGTVFRAVDQSLDRIVAVKFLLPELQAEPLLVESFRREARAVASVRHDNVLQIYAFGRYGETPFFVMEFIEGRSAEDLLVAAIRRAEKPPLDEVLWILDQTAAGLAAVHGGDVVHRDIKPGNLMLQDETRRVVIMDFGLGHRYKPGDPRLSADGVEPGGTPAYMAPELIAGKKISPRDESLTDVYAYGVTAFELLTAELPFSADNWVDIFQQHLTEPPPRPSSMRSDLPAGLDEVVLKCLAKAPAERYQRCEEIQDDLAVILRPPKQSPVPELPTTEPRKPLPSNGGAPSFIGRRARIVVADPDPGFRAQVLQAAEEQLPGCRFRAARTPQTAMDIARSAPPLVLIAPANDPSLNGVEFAAMMGGDEELSGVKLVLTAESMTANERKFLEQLGVFRILVKPVAGEELEMVFRAAADAAELSSSARRA